MVCRPPSLWARWLRRKEVPPWPQCQREVSCPYARWAALWPQARTSGMLPGSDPNWRPKLEVEAPHFGPTSTADRLDTHSQFQRAFTALGSAHRVAPDAPAKGKIERRHDYWQKRLPPLLAADQILELEGANRRLDQLLPHANQYEIHRELGTTPQAARDLARSENRSVLRPAPACPWWPFVWSQQARVRVDDDGTVPVGTQRQSIDAPPRTTVIRCLRPDGDVYYLRHAPNPKAKPEFPALPGFLTRTPSTFDRTRFSTFESYTRV